MIDNDIVKYLPNVKIHPPTVNPVAANQTPIKIIGEIFVTIQFGDVTEKLQAHIQKDCTVPVTLGMDLFNRYKNVLFNWERAIVVFKNMEIPIHCTQFIRPENRGIVQLPQTMVIEPRSINQINVPVPHVYIKWLQYSLSPLSPKLPTYIYLTAYQQLKMETPPSKL